MTIPKAVRDLLALKAGSQVDFHQADYGRIVLTAVGTPELVSRFESLRGHAGKGLDTDAIMALTRGDA